MKKYFISFLCAVSFSSCWAVHGATSQPNNNKPIIIAESSNIADLLADAGITEFTIAKNGASLGGDVTDNFANLTNSSGKDDINFNPRYSRAVFIGNYIPKKTKISGGYYQLSTASILNIPDQIESLGKAFGDPIIAHQNATRLREILAQYATHPNKTPASFVMILGKSGSNYTVAGAHTFMSQVWEMAGGKNLIEKTGVENISSSELQKLNPSLIIFSKSDHALQQEISSKKSITVAPGIFFTYTSHLIDQGLSEASLMIG